MALAPSVDWLAAANSRSSHPAASPTPSEPQNVRSPVAPDLAGCRQKGTFSLPLSDQLDGYPPTWTRHSPPRRVGFGGRGVLIRSAKTSRVVRRQNSFYFHAFYRPINAPSAAHFGRRHGLTSAMLGFLFWSTVDGWLARGDVCVGSAKRHLERHTPVILCRCMLLRLQGESIACASYWGGICDSGQ